MNFAYTRDRAFMVGEGFAPVAHRNPAFADALAWSMIFFSPVKKVKTVRGVTKRTRVLRRNLSAKMVLFSLVSLSVGKETFLLLFNHS